MGGENRPGGDGNRPKADERAHRSRESGAKQRRHRFPALHRLSKAVFLLLALAEKSGMTHSLFGVSRAIMYYIHYLSSQNHAGRAILYTEKFCFTPTVVEACQIWS
jgi:hypothetical protein